MTIEKVMKLQYPDFTSTPINSFQLPEATLSFRGDSSHAFDCEPDDFVSFNVDFNDDNYVSKYLLYQTIDEQCLYLRLGRLSFNAQAQDHSLKGGFYIPVNIARLQNIKGITDIREINQLKLARQTIHQKQSKAVDGMSPPDHKLLTIGDAEYLVENSTLTNSAPCYLFFRPIDHRHALMIDVTFEGFLPMGTPFPPELHDACMNVVKDFLGHIELTKSE